MILIGGSDCRGCPAGKSGDNGGFIGFNLHFRLDKKVWKFRRFSERGQSVQIKQMKLGGDKMFRNTGGGNILRAGAGFPFRYGNGGRIAPHTFTDYRCDSSKDISEQYQRAGESIHFFSSKIPSKYNK